MKKRADSAATSQKPNSSAPKNATPAAVPPPAPMDFQWGPIAILDSAIKGNTTELHKLRLGLQMKGWCVVQLPEEYQKRAARTFKEAEEVLGTYKLPRDLKRRYHVPPTYGYTSTGRWKQGFHFVLDDGPFSSKTPCPLELRASLYWVRPCLGVQLWRLVCGTNLFGVDGGLRGVPNIPMTNISHGRDEMMNNAGLMLDITRTLKHQKDVGSDVICDAHTDPGLLSLNYWNDFGLQFFDPTDISWIDMPSVSMHPNLGVVWLGNAAEPYGFRAGLHRVVYPSSETRGCRYSMWVEAYDAMQALPIIEEGQETSPGSREVKLSSKMELLQQEEIKTGIQMSKRMVPLFV